MMDLTSLNTIRQDFESVIKYSQGLDVNIDASKLFDDFLYAKRFFIDRFDGLIYEYPEKVSLPLDENDNITVIMENVIEKISHYLNENDDNLSSISQIQIALVEFWLVKNMNGFLSNKIVANTDFTLQGFDSIFNKTIVDVEKRQILDDMWKNIMRKIPKGTKLLKSLKYFIDDKKVLRVIQDLCSQNIQTAKYIEGTLCLSVHPLDFLSSSENAHNWRSCHALDGEYRSGNVSYMMDESTFMVYIKADGEYQLPHFPEGLKWNSKKLRRLFFLSEQREMMFAGRSYPFNCDALLDFLRENVFNKILVRDDIFMPTVVPRKYYWSDWTDETLDSYVNQNGETLQLAESYYNLGGFLKNRESFIKDSKSALHYNDLLYSSCYKPKYTFLMHVTDVGNKNYKSYLALDGEVFSDLKVLARPYSSVSDHTRFKIGGDCKCLRCKKKIIFDSGTFLCKDCELAYGHACTDMIMTCPVCGNRFVDDEGVYNSKLDEIICPDCYQEYSDEDDSYGDEERYC